MKTLLSVGAVAVLAGVALAPTASVAQISHRHFLALAPGHYQAPRADAMYPALTPHGPYAAYAARGPHLYVSGRAYPNPFAFPSNVSYGTGYHGTGSITGGPAGGLPSRN